VRSLRPVDYDLDPLSRMYVFECLFSVLELDTTGDELLDAQATGSDEVNSQLIVSGPISERTPKIYFLGTNSHDWEVDVRLAHTTLNVGSASSHCVDSSLDARLGSSSVDDGIGTQAEVALFCENPGVLLRADSLRAEGMSGSILLCECETLLVDIDGDDLGGTERLCDGHAEQTYRASTKDNNALAGLDVGLLGDVHADTQWLNQCSLLKGNMVRNLVAKVLGKTVVLGESSVVRRGGCEGHVDTEVVLALSATWASTARNTGLQCDAVALLECRHLVSHLLDDTSRLVTQNHGCLDDKVTDGAVSPVVHIRTADTGVLDIDDDIVGVSELGDGTILEFNAVGLLKNKGQVLWQ